jgi:diaminohydroxyphosphoribosylaminopyrimidine deaminase / 5-amino-6-(5-phosphoribosylamino)uracil reductase
LFLELNDNVHMRHALALAARGLGRVAPNPAVGCVIVADDERVAGRGWTQPGGRPHAETEALAAAKELARGATAYVTLEPCAHQGQTPPCADALVRAGVRRVVVALGDPDPRVKGAGIKRLRAAGLVVETGLLQAEAERLNEGFLRRIREGRPLVTLKIAQSIDGRIALASGHSKWITGEMARAYGHFLRAQHDAILIGIETVLADDPLLTVRGVAGLEDRSPSRVVLDTHGRLPVTSKLAQTSKTIPTILFTASETCEDLRKLGVDVVTAARGVGGRIDMAAMLRELGGRGVTRLLVEGGARVHASFLSGGLVDRMEVFTAPLILGGDARSAATAIGLADLAQAPHFESVATRRLGPDLLESFVRKA